MVKKLHICEKVYFDQLIFQYCFYYSFTLYYCAIVYSLDVGFFQYHQDVKQFGFRSGRLFVGTYLGKKLFAKVISRLQKLPLAGKVFLIQCTTFWLKPWQKSIAFGSILFHLANVLASTNSGLG